MKRLHSWDYPQKFSVIGGDFLVPDKVLMMIALKCVKAFNIFRSVADGIVIIPISE